MINNNNSHLRKSGIELPLDKDPPLVKNCKVNA